MFIFNGFNDPEFGVVVCIYHKETEAAPNECDPAELTYLNAVVERNGINTCELMEGYYETINRTTPEELIRRLNSEPLLEYVPELCNELEEDFF